MDKKMKLVLDIMQLGVEISKNTKTDVFVSYEGHVDELDIRAFNRGWSDGRNADYKKSIYLDTTKTRTEKDITKTLEEIYAELANIYKEDN